ncbi:hypothetical protein ID866_2504 [Astraeus odoratus]|nr:hypothetical protein ID866_2504 [Astraeus odoratus]
MEESSQEPWIGRQRRSAVSVQPSPEFLASLGIKVRDFAYENTLPPINPVLRIPRQVQPEPPPRKRALGGWDEEGSQDQGTSSQSVKPNSQRLERKATEPLDNESLMYGRTLQAPFRTMTRPAIRLNAQSVTPTQITARSPPTSPLSSSFSQEASQESDLPRTPSPMKLVANDTSIVTALQDQDSRTSIPEDIVSCVLSSEPVAPSFFSVSSSQLPRTPSLAVPEDLVFDCQRPSMPGRRSGTRRAADSTPEAPSPGRYQLRRRPSTRSRRPQPYPVTSTVTKKSSLSGPRSRRARQGPVR